MPDKKNKNGFTLIEILVAIAIVSILASVVLVSMASYRTKARSAKALAQLSSSIPSMISCWGNSGKVYIPVGGVSVTSSKDICSLGSDYGAWPRTQGDLADYKYEAGDADSDCASAPGGTVCADKMSWFIALSDDSNKVRVCCNSTLNSCKVQYKDGTGWEAACDASTPSY